MNTSFSVRTVHPAKPVHPPPIAHLRLDSMHCFYALAYVHCVASTSILPARCCTGRDRTRFVRTLEPSTFVVLSGGFIMVFGIWKGRPRVLYGIYLCLTLGIAASSIAGSMMASSALVSENEFVPHTLHKREILTEVNATTSSPLSRETVTTKPTRYIHDNQSL